MQPAAVLQIFVDAQTGKAERNLHRLNTGLQASERQATKTHKAIGVATTGMKYLGIAAGVAAGALLYKSVKAGATFERQMSNLKSVTGATTKELGRFEDQALKLGESTQYTANQVAEAQVELAKGGLTLKQIYGGAVQSALSLAAAGQLELAEAAETTVNVMKLFGLRGKDTQQIADMLATAANKTTADVTDFAMALKQGGSVAKIAGLNLNETVTILESLAEAGIKNSDAGTSMKVFFNKIGNPSTKAKKAMEELNLSLFDQEGQLKKLPAVSAELQKSFGDLTKQEFLKQAGTIAGTDSIRTLYALYAEGPKKIKALEEANKKQGTAQKVAAEKMNNLQGDWEQFTGALETGEIKLYQVLKGPLRDATQWATGIVQELANTNYAEVWGEIEGFYNNLHNSTKVEVAGSNFSLFPETGELEKSSQWIINASKNTFNAVVAGYEWLETAASKTYNAVATGVQAVIAGWNAFTGAIGDGIGWIKRAASNVSGFVTSLIPLKIAAGIAYLAIKTLIGGIKFAISVLEIFEPAVSAAAGILKTVIVAAVHVVTPAIQTMLKYIGNIAAVFGDVVGLISNLLRGKWANAWNNAKQLVADVVHTFEDLWKGGWTVVKALFTNGVGAIKSILKSAFGGIKGMFINAAKFMGSAFSSTWDKIEGIFVGGANGVISVINAVIGAINAIPGIPNIGTIGLVGSHGVSNGKTGKDVNGKSLGRQSGGFVEAAMGALAATVPGGSTGDNHLLSLNGRTIAKVESGEGIFVGNRNAMGAAKALNDSVPRFQKGGQIPGFITGGDILGGIGKVAKTAAEYSPAGLAVKAGEKVFNSAKAVIGALPSGAGIPEPFKGVGPYVVGKAADWIKGLPSSIFGGGGSGGGTKGPKGVGSYKGVPMSNWVIESLEYAAGKGAAPQPTSGYRSHAQNVSEGRNYFSEHEKTQYPGGAVDFGGYNSGLAAKMSVVNATRSFKYPLLAPIGFHDDGHASGTGHQLGGLIQMLAKGGPAKSEGSTPALDAFLSRTWQKAAPLYGQAAGSPYPVGDYLAKGLTGTEGDVGKVEDGPSGRRLFFDKGWMNRAMKGGHYGLGSLLHEWAHVFQKPGLSRWEREGGATDFSRYAAPKVFGFDETRYPSGYKKFAERVKSQLGDSWITNGQFGRQRGGAVDPFLQKLQSGGFIDATSTQKNVALQIARDLLGEGLNYKGAAGVIGNAWRESNWTPSAEGTGGGGLWGFTTPPISLADLKAAGGSNWADVDFQTGFMWNSPGNAKSLKGALNAQPSAASAAKFFDSEWEHSGIKAMPDRMNGAREALALMTGSKLKTGSGAEDEHTYKEDVPAMWGGLAAGKDLKFPSGAPKTLDAIQKELSSRKAEKVAYKKAIKRAEGKKLPGVVQALQKNLVRLESRIAELERARYHLRVEKAKTKFTAKVTGKLADLTGWANPIKLAERGFNQAQEYASETVEMEPLEEKDFGAWARWINEKEKPAYGVLFERAADWRNTILHAERAAAGQWEAKGPLGGLEGGWENKILDIGWEISADENIIKKAEHDQEAFKAAKAKFEKEHPNAKHPFAMSPELRGEMHQADLARKALPFLNFQNKELRGSLGKAREEFYPGGARIKDNPVPAIPGSGTFEGELENVQGDKWPTLHKFMARLPTHPELGGFGGAIRDVQNQSSELELKMSDALGAAFESVAGSFGGEGDLEAGSSGESEAAQRRAEYWEEQTRLANQRFAVISTQRPIIDAYASKNFAGLFAKGGSIPTNMWGIAGEAGPEIVRGPVSVTSNRDSAAVGTASLGGLHVAVTNHRDGSTSVEAELNGKQIDQVRKTVKQGNRDAGRRAKTSGARNAGRIG